MSGDHFNPPAVTITIALEQPISLTCNERDPAQLERLRLWIATHPDLAKIYTAAFELAHETAA